MSAASGGAGRDPPARPSATPGIGAETRPLRVERVDDRPHPRPLRVGERPRCLDLPARADRLEPPDRVAGRPGHGQAAASALIASTASLKPPLVSDEPATRRDRDVVDVLAHHLVLDAADELRLVLLGLRAVCGSPSISTARDDVAREGEGHFDRLDRFGRRVRPLGRVRAVCVAAGRGSRSSVDRGVGRRCRPPWSRRSAPRRVARRRRRATRAAPRRGRDGERAAVRIMGPSTVGAAPGDGCAGMLHRTTSCRGLGEPEPCAASVSGTRRRRTCS